MSKIVITIETTPGGNPDDCVIEMTADPPFSQVSLFGCTTSVSPDWRVSSKRHTA